MDSYQQQYARVTHLARHQGRHPEEFALEVLDQLNERIPLLFFTHPQQLHAALLISASIVIGGGHAPPPSLGLYLFLYHRKAGVRKLPPLDTPALFKTFCPELHPRVLDPFPFERFPDDTALDPHVACCYWDWKNSVLEKLGKLDISPTKMEKGFQASAHVQFRLFSEQNQPDPHTSSRVIALLTHTNFADAKWTTVLHSKLSTLSTLVKQVRKHSRSA